MQFKDAVEREHWKECFLLYMTAKSSNVQQCAQMADCMVAAERERMHYLNGTIGSIEEGLGVPEESIGESALKELK